MTIAYNKESFEKDYIKAIEGLCFIKQFINQGANKYIIPSFYNQLISATVDALHDISDKLSKPIPEEVQLKIDDNYRKYRDALLEELTYPSTDGKFLFISPDMKGKIHDQQSK